MNEWVGLILVVGMIGVVLTAEGMRRLRDRRKRRHAIDAADAGYPTAGVNNAKSGARERDRDDDGGGWSSDGGGDGGGGGGD